MPSVNESIRDLEIGHQVDALRVTNATVRRIIALLNRTDSALFAELSSLADKMGEGSFSVVRLEQFLVSVRTLNAQAYAAISRELPIELAKIAESESGYQLRLFEAAVPPQVVVQVGVNAVNAQQVYAAAMSRPFQGRLLSEWMQGLELDRAARVRDTLRIGYTQGETIDQMVRRLRGTKAKGYSDGIIEIDRRNAEAVVRTATSHVAANVKEAFYEANNDLVKAVQWVSTLDARTTPQCRVRDHLVYTPGKHKPIGHSVPWLAGPGKLHWNCRSTSVPILKSFRELGIDIDEVPASTRASMDGQVPRETTYLQWLESQDAPRQDQILGPVRGKLHRSGGLPIDRFSNDKGEFLTLDQLRERDSEAFRRAGL